MQGRWFGVRLAFSRRSVGDRSATGCRLIESNRRTSATNRRLIGDLSATGRRLFYHHFFKKNKVFGKNTTISVKVAIMIAH